jgi:hypothetical protein
MNHTRKIISSFGLVSLALAQSAFAANDRTDQKLPLAKFPPIITNVGTTSATISLPKIIDQKDVSRAYFEYQETKQVCIMIYPTPESCLPKTTTKGATSTTLTGLKPGTEYWVKWKLDSEIKCITTPCPTNEQESDMQTFTTLSEGGPASNVSISQNLRYRMTGADVTILQTILINMGFLKTEATGYFGIATQKAVKEFQKSAGLPPTGFVGPLTRIALATYKAR